MLVGDVPARVIWGGASRPRGAPPPRGGFLLIGQFLAWTLLVGSYLLLLAIPMSFLPARGGGGIGGGRGGPGGPGEPCSRYPAGAVLLILAFFVIIVAPPGRSRRT